MSKWTYYYPSEGDTADDAQDVPMSHWLPTDPTAEEVAVHVVEMNWYGCDSDMYVDVTVVSPRGEEYTFECWSEVQVVFQAVPKREN